MRNPPNPHPSLHPNRRERRHGRHRMEQPRPAMLAGRRVVVGVAAFAVASVGLSAVSAGASNAPQVSAAVPGIDLSHTNTLPSTADELDAATAGSLDLPTLAAILRAGAILGAAGTPGAIPGLSAGLPDAAARLTAAGLVPQGQDPATATATDIPARVLLAYRAAAARAALENPSCGIRWEFLAAFGRMETNHGRFGGSSVAENGVTTPPIYGAPLNGSRPGVIGTITTASGAADRAAGPMQFISSTWAAWGRGGDVQNIDDATNGAARYLCAGGRDLTTAAGRNAAALSYNHADWYAADIEALFQDYVSGRHGASYPAQPPVDAPVAPTGDLFGTPADGPAPAPTATATAPAPSTGTPAPTSAVPTPSGNPTPTNTSPAPTSATPAPTDATRAPAPSAGNPTPAPTSATPTPSGNPTPAPTSATPAPTDATRAPAPSAGNPTPAPTSATPAPTDATRAPAPSTGNPTPAPTSATPTPSGNPTPTNTSPAPTSATPAPTGNPTSTPPAPRTTPIPASTPPPPGTPTPTAPAPPTLNLTVAPTPAKAPEASPQATPDLLPVLPVPLAPGVLPLGGR